MLKKIGIALALAALLAAPAAASSVAALSLVPEDAAVVGSVRLADLRSNPFQLRVFEETDRIASDGDGARFLKEAGLDIRNDVDSVVACTSANGSRGRALVFFEGRFDPTRISAALAQRGSVKRSTAAGEYYRIEHSENDAEAGAVAFLGSKLIAAGNESEVAAALARKASGAAGFSAGSTGLGREFHRVDPESTAWVLIDVARSRAFHESDGANGVMKALASVSLAALQATVDGDALTIKAVGLSDDEETRELLEDSLRGVTAAWRMAAQEKSPDLVSAIRKFRITRDEEGVTISGALPGDLIRSMTAEARSRGAR